jgi:hypothetical protein
VGDPRSRRGTALSVSPKTARWLDAGQLVEIKIDDGLQCLTGGAVAQCLGQRIEPCCILDLERQECGDRAVPLLRSASLADRPRQAPRWCRSIVDLSLAKRAWRSAPLSARSPFGLRPLRRISSDGGAGLYSVT